MAHEEHLAPTTLTQQPINLQLAEWRSRASGRSAGRNGSGGYGSGMPPRMGVRADEGRALVRQQQASEPLVGDKRAGGQLTVETTAALACSTC